MKLNPESFNGKIWLLIIDKVIIGALIGVALLIYENIKTNEERAYIEKREEIQLSIKQAELKKQFIPIVLDTSKNVRERVHSLISLVQTKSIDPYGAISLAGNILENSKLDNSGYLQWKEHPDLRYLLYELYEIAPNALPELLEKYLTEYAFHLKDFYASQQSGDAVLSLAKNAETGLWIKLLRYALERNPSSFKKLNERDFLVEHLETFDNITPTVSQDEALIWTTTEILGLKIIGSLELIAINKSRPQETEFIVQQLKLDKNAIDYQLNSILFHLILHKRAILSKEISKTAFDLIDSQKKTIEKRTLHFEKQNPERDLFFKASEYLIWSCSFAQIDSVMEPIILPEIEKFIEYMKSTDLREHERVNSPFERTLIESRITSNSAWGLAPSALSKETLNRLFEINDETLDAFNILDLKDKWKKAHNTR